MAFTEFYTNFSTGANINAGDLTANGVVTSTNGGWSTVTNIFTATGGTPFSGVSVGDFCSLYADGGTVSVYIARVTAIGAGGLTLTLSATAKSGTAPTTAATGITATTGGAWKGPNAASAFPFAFISGSMTNASGDTPRVNMKNTATYDITSGITHNVAGPTYFQGYSSTVGDGGKAQIDGSTNAIVPLTSTGADCVFHDLIVANNGSSGANNGFVLNAVRNMAIGCVVHDIRGNGLVVLSNFCIVLECEAYACNSSNTGGTTGGINLGSRPATALRCVSHDNTGSNSIGFVVASGSHLVNCIADTNGGVGFNFGATGSHQVVNCDAYNNGSHGMVFGANSSIDVENCNLIKNAGYGISGGSSVMGRIANCGFGAGTQANTSGTTNTIGSAELLNNITYASNVTPWTDPANGDFTISLAAARGTGRGNFTQTASSYGPTTSKPDVGAALRGGTFPTQAQVETGVQYGAGGTEFTGSFSGGGGGGGPIVGPGAIVGTVG